MPPPTVPATRNVTDAATSPRRVLVTGGSGFIGRALVPALLELGHDVVNLDLHPGPGRWVRGDVRTPPPDLAAADVVLHLAGLAGDAEPETVLHDVNAGGAAAVLAAAGRSGAARLVLVSSIAALGPSDLPLDERAPLRPTTAYGRSKAAAEQIVQQHPAPPEVCVVRPGYVFGPAHPGNFGRMLRAIVRRRFVLPGRPDTLKAGIALPDLVDLLTHLVTAPTVPPVVHAVYPDTPTIAEVCAHLSSARGIDRTVPVLPDPLVRGGLAVLTALGAALPRARRLVVQVGKLRSSSNVVSRELGVTVPAPRRDWPTALHEMAGDPGTGDPGASDPGSRPARAAP